MAKKILRGFIIVLIIANFFFLGAVYAEKAVVLSDAELDEISAAGFDIDINSVLAFRSSVAAQSNISAVNGLSAHVVSLTNSNFANIHNIGNSAVALQSNIAAVVAKSGDINGATINNRNEATISNTANTDTEGYAEASSLNADIPAFSLLGINNVYAAGSAVASQSNIAAIVALAGNIKNAFIDNYNDATLTNFGNSAVAAQSNIAVIVAQKDIDTATINNTNLANVANTLNDVFGGANLQNFTYSGVWGNLNINHLSLTYSEVASQSNIAIIVSLAGSITNASIQNYNPAGIQLISPESQ